MTRVGDLLLLASLGAGLLALNGCATMANGASGTQEVVVTSSPAGAQVIAGGRVIGVTPVRLDLRRRDSRIVLRFEKDGFEPAERRVTQSLSGWLALDLFPLNPYMSQGMSSADQAPNMLERVGLLALAFGVDLLTGAAYKLTPAVHVVMTPSR